MSITLKNTKPMNTHNIHIGGRQRVNPKEVVMLQADVNYTVLFFANGKKAIVATTLKSLEPRFVPFDFFRTHKSYLVNLKCIQNFSEVTNMLQMVDNHIVTVSRRRRMSLKTQLSYL
jgi:DNA-binding LytR/AlgR family response regulator